MNKNYFANLSSRTQSSEKAEIMPAAIITAVVSSIVLLGIVIVLSLLVQNKAEQTDSMELSTTVSNIDVSLRSDITQASFVVPNAKLKQPESRLLSSNDIELAGITLHVPNDNGECKVIKWSVNGATLTRVLTQYQTTLDADTAKCDETSPVVTKRNKEFTGKFLLQIPFTFTNHTGRELSYKLEDSTLDKINTELDKQLTAEGTDHLSMEEFDQLNKFLTSTSLSTGFVNPVACVMNADKVDDVCPTAESATLEQAWNATTVAKVGLSFDMINDAGEAMHRNIEQATATSAR